MARIKDEIMALVDYVVAIKPHESHSLSHSKDIFLRLVYEYQTYMRTNTDELDKRIRTASIMYANITQVYIFIKRLTEQIKELGKDSSVLNEFVFEIHEGRKYYKVLCNSIAHSFILKKQESKFSAGDIFKAASQAGPVKQPTFRNVFNMTFDFTENQLDQWLAKQREQNLERQIGAALGESLTTIEAPVKNRRRGMGV